MYEHLKFGKWGSNGSLTTFYVTYSTHLKFKPNLLYIERTFKIYWFFRKHKN